MANKRKKILDVLEQEGIVTKKDILELKSSKEKELVKKGLISINDLKIIWDIQDDLLNKDILQVMKEK